MESALITGFLVVIIIGSILGGLILWPLAKSVGKVSNAAFGNSFLVCLMSSLLVFIVWYLVGIDAIKLGFAGIFLFNLALLSAAYVTVGKFIWKCEWTQSVKANMIWIVLYAMGTGAMMSQFT